ncbi:DDE-type integrase/transposase/recombinase [Pseudogracilibacillus auburnensis]|uniref:Integrase-like protein n=1 Tax=Pseudogracilibacillus auburnensis TaxID=1494959 RepID=A0A2V3VW89_9BACI|nr:integrase-like protein [Pseudogracilibacillus auburnensis]
MAKGRSTTWKEKIDIVYYCLSVDKDYQGTAVKYKVSYQQVYQWVRKYEVGGIDALKDRRGRNKTVENTLNREFSAENPNQKWVTDVTEFKYGNSKKVYLSAILDLYDNTIVSYVVGHSDNNQLVFETFDNAINTLAATKPLIHSDRG